MSESVSGTHGQGSAPQANTGPGDEVRSSALCLSGGGIRSAAFSIGVLQALHKALGARALPTDTFHFISTVSGGGFAGAWYRAWLHRARLSQQRCAEPSPRQVDAARSPRTPQNGNATGAAKGASQTDVDGTATKDRETRKVREDGGGLEEALQSLRADVGGYLEGSAGDLVLVYLGKLLLFWVFAIPALWTGLLLAAWPASLVVAWAETKNWPATVVVGLTVLLGTAILVALQHPAGRRYVAGATVGGLVFAAAYFLVFGQAHWPLSSIVATLSLPAALGWLASSSRLSQLRWAVESLGAARLIRLTASLAIVLLFVGLAKALSLCLSLFRVWMRKICLYSLGLWLEQNHLPFGEWVQLHSRPQEEWAAPAFLVLLLAVTLVAGLKQARWVSLAEEYRKHIRKTFGLTCDGKAGAPPVDLCQLRDDPQLVINAAVSVNEKVHRQWDERKAAAFAWTPKGHVNLWKVEEELEKNRCARQPDQGRHTGQREREQQTPWLDPRVERFELIETASAVDVDLAIATSAAVAGPRMGSFTARPIGLLLLFFNVRLGQWFERDATKFTVEGRLARQVLAELRSHTKESKRIHVTDGGHFDNLGLYEMIRRKCTHIIVVDAGRDPGYRFSDLANAARKIRIDLGVEIEIDGLRWNDEGVVEQEPSKLQSQRIYGGTIRYPAEAGLSDDGRFGWIVYVKAALIGDEPADVAGYSDLHPGFPHESTADQWFSESQFESYRRLGEFTISSALDHYEAAKALAASSAEREKTLPAAAAIVLKLREAAMIAGREELRHTHGGAIVGVRDAAAEALRFLLVKSINGDCWVLPKGHIERGESPLECARRELHEEAGIDVCRCEQKGALFDKFPKGGREARCIYFLFLPKDASWRCKRTDPEGLRKSEAIERRDRIWVTAAEYANALRHHRETSGGRENDGLRGLLPFFTKERRAAGPYDEELLNARTLIRELLWLLEEADRRLQS